MSRAAKRARPNPCGTPTDGATITLARDGCNWGLTVLGYLNELQSGASQRVYRKPGPPDAGADLFDLSLREVPSLLLDAAFYGQGFFGGSDILSHLEKVGMIARGELITELDDGQEWRLKDGTGLGYVIRSPEILALKTGQRVVGSVVDLLFNGKVVLSRAFREGQPLGHGLALTNFGAAFLLKSQRALDSARAAHGLSPVHESITAPQEAADDLDALVTLSQVAPLADMSKRTLERHLSKGRLPLPDYPGGDGKAHKWVWKNMRPALEKISRRPLPERFPGSRLI